MPATRFGSLPGRLTTLSCISALLLLTGCGDGSKNNSLTAQPLSTGSSSSSSGAGSSSSSSSSSSSGGVNPNGVTVSVDMASSTLSLGGSTAITLTFEDADGSAMAVPGNWTATSPCLDSNASTLNGPVVMSQSVSFNYSVVSCTGQDHIQFTGTDGTDTYGASGAVTVVENQVSYIEWANSSPEQIAIRGTGGVETASVSFQVGGYWSEGVAGEHVEFRLEGAAGGVRLVETSAVSDSSGMVTARVQSGTVPNLVTVVATHVGTQAEAYSGGLLVATGLPLAGHFNIGLSVFNPDAWGRINEETTEVTVAVTDRSGNPVLDGTKVNFFSQEGGAISPSCVTVDNTCTVTWKPDGRQPDDGRVQILAVVKGSEYFVDNNGNYLFDDGDVFDVDVHDLGEPFSDNNENGEYDAGEHFVNTDNGPGRSVGDGSWNGPNCQHSSQCGSRSYVDLAAQTTIFVAKGKTPTICNLGDFADITIGVEGTVELNNLFLSDGNSSAENPGHVCLTGNPLPNGTEVSFSVSAGSLRGTSNWVIGNEVEPTGPYSIDYKAPNTAGVEKLYLTITTPTALFETSWRIVVEAAEVEAEQ